MENHFYWSEKYSQLNTGGIGRSAGYTDKQLATFPRYNVLSAILFAVERYRPEDFKTLDEAKRFFCLVANDAESIFTKPPNGEIEQKVMSEERGKLCEFINQLNEEDLKSAEPLFYRRVLSDEESKAVRDKLQSVWQIPEHYWYPLLLQKPENVEAFQDNYFEKEVGAEKLQEILCNRGIEKVWEIREDGLDYELELSVFEPYYNGAEGFWCDAKFDWIVYASHESSITVGGWLLAEIKDIWANWEKRIWTTPFFN
jgi:hypothetical protein